MMTTKKKSAPAKATAADVVALNTLQVKQVPGKSDALLLAESALSATAGNASTARTFAHHSFGHTGINQSIAVIQEKAAKVQAGDLSEMEALLVAQATSLDAIYTEMARRAALNMGEHLAATEIYMRLALKAQSQCRSTLESLAEIKAPRHVSFVKQANIAHGPQQVNNGNAPAHGTTRFSQTNYQRSAMSYFRTPEHRRLRAELIRQWKPWEWSSGPQTESGKAASAANSLKHGNRSQEALELLRDLRAYLRRCKEVTE
jgi:hypothetical protein